MALAESSTRWERSEQCANQYLVLLHHPCFHFFQPIHKFHCYFLHQLDNFYVIIHDPRPQLGLWHHWVNECHRVHWGFSGLCCSYLPSIYRLSERRQKRKDGPCLQIHGQDYYRRSAYFLFLGNILDRLLGRCTQQVWNYASSYYTCINVNFTYVLTQLIVHHGSAEKSRRLNLPYL